jgi:hypothetical protein
METEEVIGLKQVTIYHGSQLVIEKPVFGEGNPRNDYGHGFYCTKELELAKEWACTEEKDGYANIYKLSLEDLKVCNLLGKEYNILNWLALLLQNRYFRVSNSVAGNAKAYLISKFLPDVKDVDVIIGYRADDSYFSFANSFLNSLLSLEQLETAMYLGELGEQTVLMSKKAFSQIHFEGFQPVDRKIYYPKRATRDKNARRAYKEQLSMQQTLDAVFILDIMREGWDNNDSRLRRNIP